jgi:hypothetical protein
LRLAAICDLCIPTLCLKQSTCTECAAYIVRCYPCAAICSTPRIMLRGATNVALRVRCGVLFPCCVVVDPSEPVMAAAASATITTMTAR